MLAPAAGQVLAVVDGHPDHAAHRGVPSIVYALGQGRRAADGWAALAGNHIMLAVQRGPVVALCHLRRGSLRVAVGQQVRPGVQVAQCGNSGNSTEPHVHVQAIDRLPVEAAQAVPMTFDGRLPHNGEIVQG